MNSRVFRVVIVSLLGATLTLGWPPSPAAAHGGGVPQLVRQPVGPYLLSAWTQPDPPRVGTLHLTVALFVSTAAQDVPVTDATVTARLQPPDGRPAVQVPLGEARPPLPGYYEVDVPLEAAGRWAVQLQVRGPAGGGEAAFDLQVQPAQRIPPLVWGSAALLIVLAAWYWRMRTSEEAG